MENAAHGSDSACRKWLASKPPYTPIDLKKENGSYISNPMEMLSECCSQWDTYFQIYRDDQVENDERPLPPSLDAFLTEY